MQIRALKFPLVLPGDDIEDLLTKHLPAPSENSIIAITSKIISLTEGRIIPKNSISSKLDLIKKESEFYLDPKLYGQNKDICLTIKHGLMIPSAGIDESNGGENYILYPNDPFISAKSIWEFLRKLYNVKNLGIVITDSTTTPMRRGVTGIALSWCGIQAVTSLIGTKDLFERKLKVTYVNNVDAIAAAAVFVMGEANEQTPVAILTDIPHVKFMQIVPTDKDIKSVIIDRKMDIYAPALSGAKWTKGSKN
jgi:putative folate metabolism gamma-glutamate ligase